MKELVLEWLIKLGHGWVTFRQVHDAGLLNMLGRLEREQLVERQNTDRAEKIYNIRYQLTDKAMLLLEKDIT